MEFIRGGSVELMRGGGVEIKWGREWCLCEINKVLMNELQRRYMGACRKFYWGEGGGQPKKLPPHDEKSPHKEKNVSISRDMPLIRRKNFF